MEIGSSVYLAGSLYYIGPPHVKCRLLISDIFYIMNFQQFSDMS